MNSVYSRVRGRNSVHLPEEWRFRCIHVWGVRFRCIYLRDDDFGEYICEGKDFEAFTRGMMISVHSCVRGRIPVHFSYGSWFRCIHVWVVDFQCIYVRNDDFSVFMCEGKDSGAFTWGMTILMHSCVMGRISMHLPEEWRFRCIHVWGVRFWCIYLRDDHFGAFMYER